MRTCGQCTYFEKASPYRWGRCKAPLPFYAQENSPILFPETAEAENCDMFVGSEAGLLDG